ncbi:hypothetical protein AVEN_29822-1 [Araneus ventricosus]|uniref:Uncharacterized protein n=1 Tax=Araneus ventricosus TaxID=182803 RepID=A0A4Y2JSZ8_ARAVE|nr:hypothetical protein AVEN_29822-1 [Araneus ventricosus]
MLCICILKKATDCWGSACPVFGLGVISLPIGAGEPMTVMRSAIVYYPHWPICGLAPFRVGCDSEGISQSMSQTMEKICAVYRNIVSTPTEYRWFAEFR